jgi:hypothetical protein
MKYKKKDMMDELRYCEKKVEEGHPSSHWAIRIKEINNELKKGKSNGKTAKTRKR